MISIIIEKQSKIKEFMKKKVLNFLSFQQNTPKMIAQQDA